MALRIARYSPYSSASFLSRPQAAASRSQFLSHSLGLLHHQLRTMASTPAKSEWLVVVPDFPGTLAKRLEVRKVHLANATLLRESGTMKFGGAIVDDIPSDPADPTTYKFAGSTLIFVADSRADVVELIKKDIYTEKGVWDVEKAQIYWLKSAFRDP